VYICT